MNILKRAFDYVFGPSKRELQARDHLHQTATVYTIGYLLTAACFYTQPVMDMADATDFLHTYTSANDAQHWETIVADVERLTISCRSITDFYVNRDVAGARALEELALSKGRFLTHMLKAYAEGDRFIVAKLAYDGGAA